MADRIQTLDVIRGVAVMGIVSVNVVDFSTMNAAYLNPAALGWPDPASLAVWALNMLLVDGKFRTLFSMLFGASMLLVIERAEGTGESGWRIHGRRMAVLLLFGLAHAILIWRGDILALYAVTGLVAYRFRELAVAKLVAWAIGLSLVNIVLFGAIGITLHQQQMSVLAGDASADLLRNWQANYHSFYPTARQVAADLAVYNGGWLTIVAHEASQAARIATNIGLLLPDTLGLMLFGMAAYKSGFLGGAWDDRRYWQVAAWGITLGLAAFGLLVVADIASGFAIPVFLAGFIAAVAPFRIAMAFGYAALFILMARRMGPVTSRFAAVGRVAFSNYLGTSLIMTSIFYGWGLGLYGDVTRAQAWLAVPIVWLLMLAWSKPWLDRFQYGPLEWAWRSLARLELQPMRKAKRLAGA